MINVLSLLALLVSYSNDSSNNQFMSVVQAFPIPTTIKVLKGTTLLSSLSSSRYDVSNAPRLMMNIGGDDGVGHVFVALSSAAQETVLSSITLSQELSAVTATLSESATSAAISSSYSQLSYFTVLGLYLLSFPGLISIIQRSTKAKMKRKTYISPGLNYKMNSTVSTTFDTVTDMTNVPEYAMNKDPLSIRDQAIEVMAYMKGNNYMVQEMTNTTITFEGVVQRSLSQAFFLTFCTVLGLLSLALVLQIQFQSMVSDEQQQSTNFFYLAFLSPYAGIYYWNAGDRVDTIQIQLSTNSDETMNEMIVYGPDDEMERMWRTLQLQEKNMIPIPSILTTPTTTTSTVS